MPSVYSSTTDNESRLKETCFAALMGKTRRSGIASYV